jgi:hypothetical protein
LGSHHRWWWWLARDLVVQCWILEIALAGGYLDG